MNDIQLVMEGRTRDALIRAWEWPEPQEVLRASLRTSPSHPRAPTELLEALARWQGRRVHAAVVGGRRDGSCLGCLFPDLFEPTAAVQGSLVEHHPCGGWSRMASSGPVRLVRRAEPPFAAGGAR